MLFAPATRKWGSLFIILALCVLYNYMLFYRAAWQSGIAHRLVLIADPQIEGDAREQREGWYGKINNQFNDFYFKFVYRNVAAFLMPSDYVVFLGDLFSNQYIDNVEYEKRKHRFDFSFGANVNASKINLVGNHVRVT